MDSIDEIYYLTGQVIKLRNNIKNNKAKLKSWVGKPIHSSTLDVIEAQGNEIAELIKQIKQESKNI